jgi:hypothetical protein
MKLIHVKKKAYKAFQRNVETNNIKNLKRQIVRGSVVVVGGESFTRDFVVERANGSVCIYPHIDVTGINQTHTDQAEYKVTNT